MYELVVAAWNLFCRSYCLKALTAAEAECLLGCAAALVSDYVVGECEIALIVWPVVEREREGLSGCRGK